MGVAIHITINTFTIPHQTPFEIIQEFLNHFKYHCDVDGSKSMSQNERITDAGYQWDKVGGWMD